MRYSQRIHITFLNSNKVATGQETSLVISEFIKIEFNPIEIINSQSLMNKMTNKNFEQSEVLESIPESISMMSEQD